MKKLRFGPTISPVQGAGPRVVCFTATPEQVMEIARVQRIGRDSEGQLSGFQRPQIAAHIREIRDYLAQPNSMLPNAIVLAFSQRAAIGKDGYLTVDVGRGPPGWVVDGQQRLCAALGLLKRKFEFIVSAFICQDAAELNRQFILVNNTRPLAKPLIYELLPGVEGLPPRLADRADAALLVERLNYGRNSSLKGKINQQTNPDGILKDTLIQRMLMSSLQHGALREFTGRGAVSGAAALVSAFFAAVQIVFQAEWEDHTPKTSRLLHGVGLISMGYVMDELAIRFGACSQKDFEVGLRPLVGRTHWTQGSWDFGSERRPWNSLQNTKADYQLVSHYLVRLVRGRGAKARAVA
jgi:DGQHR domain-containing protein